MIKVYFDDVLIDTDSYVQLDNDYKLFTDSFKLGSVASDTFSLGVVKNAVSTQPINVRIEDDTTIFNFIVDKIVEDDNVYTYSLTDKLLNFNFDYDASVLINTKAENEEECYLSDIWKDMCLQANVEYDETYVFENDIVVNWYDNRVQARRYLSFIAELQSGYACILENGKQSFKKQKRSSVKTIDGDECSDLIIGEKKTITRVVYDGGTFKWEFGDETGDTLYLQSDNVFIVNEQIVENIYNNIKDFEFYIIDVPQAPMDSTVKAGDIITFDDNGKLYPTIAQYKMSYAGGWTGGYQLKVNTTKQQETQITRTSQQVRNIQTKVDRLNNEFSVIAEEIEKLTDYIRNVGTTGNYLMLPDTPKSGGAINTLSIKGFELRELYPGMAYPSEYTYPGVLNFYTLIFDTVPTFDREPNYVFVNSPIPLQKLGSVYDELLIEANKVKVIQRIGYDFDNEQWSVLSSPITHELEDVLLPTFEGDTYISVRYFDNLVYDAEYLIKNDLTSNFATQLESSSQFKINQDEISSKVNKDGIISEINQSAEQVKIAANKIKFEGVVTANENFKVLLDGSIEAKNGNFQGNVTADNLYLNSGGRVISGDGLITNIVIPSNIISRGYLGGSALLPMGFSTRLDNFVRDSLQFDFDIPDDFVVVSAYMTINHLPIDYYFEGSFERTGYTRNIRLYKTTGFTSGKLKIDHGWWEYSTDTYGTWNEITNAFGSNGFTGSNSGFTSAKSIDIKDEIDVGFNSLRLQSSFALPTTGNQLLDRTGACNATLTITGYMSFSE
jgi:hypothetical protein